MTHAGPDWSCVFLLSELAFILFIFLLFHISVRCVGLKQFQSSVHHVFILNAKAFDELCAGPVLHWSSNVLW